jgi:CheY-like chemotaxis protein|tara:strand:+ start:799 stop:1122 length:324 start_codon:yes stop_codon:yes gene_type:complete
MPLSRGETILVVEDDKDVRTLVVGLLTSLGYHVIDADMGTSALVRLDQHPDIDLLLTDVVLPGPMTGRDLATEVQRRYPAVKALDMSGYISSAIVHHGRLDADAPLL